MSGSADARERGGFARELSMKPLHLLAPMLALALADPSGAEPARHFMEMGVAPQSFTRLPGDPDAATIRLDLPAIAAVRPDADGVVQLKVSYDDARHAGWSAETGLDPRFESIFASTSARARLVATSTTPYERNYWFVTGEDIAPVVSALRALPQPTGAQIAVIRSNRDALEALKPTADELKGAPR
jgi:hypothetical protein